MNWRIRLPPSAALPSQANNPRLKPCVESEKHGGQDAPTTTPSTADGHLTDTFKRQAIKDQPNGDAGNTAGDRAIHQCPWSSHNTDQAGPTPSMVNQDGAPRVRKGTSSPETRQMGWRCKRAMRSADLHLHPVDRLRFGNQLDQGTESRTACSSTTCTTPIGMLAGSNVLAGEVLTRSPGRTFGSFSMNRS